LLGRDRATSHRLGDDDVARLAAGRSEEAAHGLLGCRHDGKPVGPPALEVRLDALRPVGDRIPGGGQLCRRSTHDGFASTLRLFDVSNDLREKLTGRTVRGRDLPACPPAGAVEKSSYVVREK